MKFSIIIPALNEEKTIQSCLIPLQTLRSQCEIIIVDGGSTDNTAQLAAALADQVLGSEQGRARQMNTGARRACGDVLMFLHADTLLPDHALALIAQRITKNQVWGRFDIRLRGRHYLLKIIARMMNWRSRLTGIATGDQVIFVTGQAFAKVGQYPEIALMEDIALSKALKKISPPICLRAMVTSSARRWEHNGIIKTILLMWCLRLGYFLGADPKTLARLYTQS